MVRKIDTITSVILYFLLVMSALLVSQIIETLPLFLMLLFAIGTREIRMILLEAEIKKTKKRKRKEPYQHE